jgi:hypothetical protein
VRDPNAGADGVFLRLPLAAVPVLMVSVLWQTTRMLVNFAVVDRLES